MGPVERTIIQICRGGDPIGAGLSRGEIPILVRKLRSRFETNGQLLDLTPGSLNRLESLLQEKYSPRAQPPEPEEDLIGLVRELTAYVGEVLRLYADGNWRFTNRLYDSMIEYRRPVETVKDGGVRHYDTAIDLPANISAASLDGIRAGKPPGFREAYDRALSKRLDERL